MQATAVFLALVAVGLAVVGLVGPVALVWAPAAVLLLSALLLLVFASVTVRITGRALEVAYGPLGRPVRRWSPGEIEVPARVEERRPMQVGGWGYRISGLGTTVMVRRGPCLVIRSRGRDFAVSVDDAQRGAALLNSLPR
ncbi:hypothetical protein GCM10010347_57700 [Streptomyces cirratus]|uniref:Bacterial Pleckstrin homology domain-containing protein n=2 Tax=Streptomyces cirratus TaxID=68187 RepID=A0ABQ3F0I4_9ACTN|nr:hypothetical protein GCM10010347_57700 [Streptomyces cirratus]